MCFPIQVEVRKERNGFGEHIGPLLLYYITAFLTYSDIFKRDEQDEGSAGCVRAFKVHVITLSVVFTERMNNTIGTSRTVTKSISVLKSCSVPWYLFDEKKKSFPIYAVRQKLR